MDNLEHVVIAATSNTDQLFLNAFHHAAFGMALIALDGKWLRVNRSTCQFFGYSEEEFLKLSVQDITYADDLIVELESMQRLLRGEIESYQLEQRYRHKDGHQLWALSSVSLARDEQDNPLFCIAQIENISERKLAEQALRISEERLGLVIQATGVGFWDWDMPTGNFVLNDRWAEMLGYTLAELYPINLHTWDPFIHPEDLKRATEALEQHFAGLTEYYECEVRLRHKYGHWVWVLDRGKVVEWDDEGKPYRMTGMHLDISERKNLEAEREKVIEQLRGALAEVHTLQGILPICSYCKQIRTDENYWQAVETYVSQLTGAEFTHGICPNCYETHVRQHLETLKSKKAADV